MVGVERANGLDKTTTQPPFQLSQPIPIARYPDGQKTLPTTTSVPWAASNVFLAITIVGRGDFAEPCMPRDPTRRQNHYENYKSEDDTQANHRTPPQFVAKRT